MIRNSSLQRLFLIETKLNSEKMAQIGNSLNFDHWHSVGASSGQGGLPLFWKNGCDWEVVFSSQWILGIKIKTIQGVYWDLWCCCCPAERVLRREFWTTLCFWFLGSK